MTHTIYADEEYQSFSSTHCSWSLDDLSRWRQHVRTKSDQNAYVSERKETKRSLYRIPLILLCGSVFPTSRKA